MAAVQGPVVALGSMLSLETAPCSLLHLSITAWGCGAVFCGGLAFLLRVGMWGPSAGGGMGFSSLGRFCFPRSIMAGLVVGPMKWGGCNAKNLCGSETAGHGSTLEHCLGGATTASRGYNPTVKASASPPQHLGVPPSPCAQLRVGVAASAPVPSPALGTMCRAG